MPHVAALAALELLRGNQADQDKDAAEPVLPAHWLGIQHEADHDRQNLA